MLLIEWLYLYIDEKLEKWASDYLFESRNAYMWYKIILVEKEESLTVQPIIYSLFTHWHTQTLKEKYMVVLLSYGKAVGSFFSPD